jgi:acyl-CoA synthetase (AMP-forming)/AMP-acid ligase II
LQLAQTSTAATAERPRSFVPGPSSVVLSGDLQQVLAPGHAGVGWLAERGAVPLGYLGDPERTGRTFPEIDGVRYAVPGDRVRVLDDGSVELLGRDSATINSGGEKIFAEEIEQALAEHPAVADVVVVGRPSDRWGSKVVAIVAPKPGRTLEVSDLMEHAGRSLARYKLPKAFVIVEVIQRSPSGKSDYRWAFAQAQVVDGT